MQPDFAFVGVFYFLVLFQPVPAQIDFSPLINLLNFPQLITSTLASAIQNFQPVSRFAVSPRVRPLNQECFEDQNVVQILLDPTRKVIRAALAMAVRGYTVTTHRATSEDGYILTILRINGGDKSPPASGKPVVVLWHGLANAGEMWTIQRQDSSLASLLADNGYDVWLVNGRGTDLSQEHVSLNANNIAYWDFSFHEMGAFDFPAVIDTVLAETGVDDVFFIGYSQGAAVFSIAMSENPQYNNRIRTAFMLAPGVYPGPIFRLLSPFLENPVIQNIIYTTFGGYIDVRNPRLLQQLSGIFSNLNITLPVGYKCGLPLPDHFNLDDDETPLEIWANMFNVANLKSFFHYSQNSRRNIFAQYDYGPLGNFQRYGTFASPSYNLTRITTPLHVWYGKTDELEPGEVVIRFVNSVQPGLVRGVYELENKFGVYGHGDFVQSSENDVILYSRILAIMQEDSP